MATRERALPQTSVPSVMHKHRLNVQSFILNTLLQNSLLVVNFKFVAAARRMLAAITGDGVHTIAELIEKVNRDPRRGNGHCKVLSKIRIDEDTQEVLTRQEITLENILPAGKEFWVKSTANLSTGGTAEDVTDDVRPANINLFERIACIINLDFSGIDIMAPDHSRTVIENGGAVIEVNAAPKLRMHLQSTSGIPRNVAVSIIDMLFPNNSKGRIPFIAGNQDQW